MTVPWDPDAIAAAVSTESSADALDRQRALQARQRRAEVGADAEAAADRVELLAAGLVVGRVSETDVVAALYERDEARRLLEAWNLAVRAADSVPVLLGRR
jgi:hypothetical protein